MVLAEVITTVAPVFVEPIFVDKLWGGSRLKHTYGFDLPNDRIGECLAISARPGTDCKLRYEDHRGATTLSELWSSRRDLFGGLAGDEFPLRVKLIDACDDLSVQVHPDSAYASQHEGDLGKNECWYVLSPSDSSEIVLGHSAETREQFAQMVHEGRWDELLNRIAMREGDFFDVPAGTIHAISRGSLVYEVQQASDVTYRLHDHHRMDNGVKRELHLAEALEVVTVPSRPFVSRPAYIQHKGAMESRFTRNEHYSVSRLDVPVESSIGIAAPFLLVGILQGSGTVNGAQVVPGDHFVVPSPTPRLEVTGPVSMMVVRP